MKAAFKFPSESLQDNFQHNAAAFPEPVLLPVMAFGLAQLMLVGRSQRVNTNEKEGYTIKSEMVLQRHRKHRPNADKTVRERSPELVAIFSE